MTISTSPIILYHASCDDGFGAAYAAWMHLGDNAEYRPVQYGDTAPLEQLVGRRVYIVDNGYPFDARKVMLGGFRQGAYHVRVAKHGSKPG